MGTFQNIIANGLESIADIASIPVRYQRKTNWTSVQAVPSTSKLYVVIDDVTVQVLSKDFLISTSDLKINGSVVLPLAGDTILETACDGKQYTHIVGRADGGEVYRFSDAGRTRLRIHTKQTVVTNA